MLDDLNDTKLTHLIYDEKNHVKSQNYISYRIKCEPTAFLANYLLDLVESNELSEELIKLDKFQFDSSYKALFSFANQKQLAITVRKT